MATATTHAARRTGAKAKRIVRNARAKVHPQRVVRQAARTGRTVGIVSLVAIGTILVLGAAAIAAAAYDPRAEEFLRRAARQARDTVGNLPSHIPDVPAPALHRLEALASQISETGQRLGNMVRSRF